MNSILKMLPLGQAGPVPGWPFRWHREHPCPPPPAWNRDWGRVSRKRPPSPGPSVNAPALIPDPEEGPGREEARPSDPRLTTPSLRPWVPGARNLGPGGLGAFGVEGSCAPEPKLKSKPPPREPRGPGRKEGGAGLGDPQEWPSPETRQDTERRMQAKAPGQ